MFVLLSAISVIILLSHYLLTIKLKIDSLNEKLVYIGTLACAQIIISQILLGIGHALYLPLVILFNVMISATITGFSVKGAWTSTIQTIKNDIAAFWAQLKDILFAPNIVMLALAAFLTLWYVLASVLLPPRVVDDLSYHLTPIFQFILTHKVYLLPISINPFIAYPFNAEFLFMWPTIFLHNVSGIGLVQFIIALLGVVTTYALGRVLDLERRINFFVSIQFLFAPVVLAQAGCAYIDIITSVFFLISLYGSVRFYQTGEGKHLFLSAVATGLMIGMKYNMPLLALASQCLIVQKLLRQPKKMITFYFLIIALLSGYWYLRNFIAFQNPVFPMDIFNNDKTIFYASQSSGLLQKYFEIHRKFRALFLRDFGLGELHGGFGLTFWGLAFPAWAFALGESFASKSKERMVSLFILAQMFTGFVMLFLVPLEVFYLSPRYSLFIVAIGLLGLGKITVSLRNYGFVYKLLVILPTAFSILALIHLATVRLPSYAVDAPLKDIMSKNFTSKYRYLVFSSYISALPYSWEAIDHITRDDPKGLSCYMAADGRFLFTAPTYGSNLQNRVWDLEEDRPQLPDVFMFNFDDNEEFTYFEHKFTPKEIFLNTDYEIIVHGKKALCFIRKDILSTKEKKLLLSGFYRNYFENQIATLNKFAQVLDPKIPIVTSTWLGFAAKASELRGDLKNQLFLIPDHPWLTDQLLLTFLEKNGLQKFYTFNNPFRAYSSREILNKEVGDVKIKIYLNEKQGH